MSEEIEDRTKGGVVGGSGNEDVEGRPRVFTQVQNSSLTHLTCDNHTSNDTLMEMN